MVTSNTNSILVVDDDPDICDFIKTAAENRGFTVTTTCDSVTAAALIKNLKPDILFTDIDMPDVDGLTLLQSIADEFTPPKIVVISGLGAVYLGVAEQLTARYGMNRICSMEKPFRLKKLRALLEACIDDNVIFGPFQ